MRYSSDPNSWAILNCNFYFFVKIFREFSWMEFKFGTWHSSALEFLWTLQKKFFNIKYFLTRNWLKFYFSMPTLSGCGDWGMVKSIRCDGHEATERCQTQSIKNDWWRKNELKFNKQVAIHAYVNFQRVFSSSILNATWHIFMIFFTFLIRYDIKNFFILLCHTFSSHTWIKRMLCLKWFYVSQYCQIIFNRIFRESHVFKS